SLVPLACGDIADNGQDRRLAFNFNKRSADLDRNDSAILGDMAALTEELSFLLLFLEPVFVAGGEFRRINVARRQLQELFACVPQPPAGRWIGIQDMPLDVMHKNAIVDPIEQSPILPIAGALVFGCRRGYFQGTTSFRMRGFSAF